MPFHTRTHPVCPRHKPLSLPTPRSHHVIYAPRTSMPTTWRPLWATTSPPSSWRWTRRASAWCSATAAPAAAQTCRGTRCGGRAWAAARWSGWGVVGGSRHGCGAAHPLRAWLCFVEAPPLACVASILNRVWLVVYPRPANRLATWWLAWCRACGPTARLWTLAARLACCTSARSPTSGSPPSTRWGILWRACRTDACDGVGRALCPSVARNAPQGPGRAWVLLSPWLGPPP
jgi:hypothetical protein